VPEQGAALKQDRGIAQGRTIPERKQIVPRDSVIPDMEVYTALANVQHWIKNNKRRLMTDIERSNEQTPSNARENLCGKL